MSNIRTALVTGASHGIGYEVARRLACQGSRVIVHAPTPAQAYTTVARLLRAGAEAGLLHAASADFRRLGDVRSLARHIGRRHDRLDLLVNNAGALEPTARTSDGLDVNFQINYVAPYALTRLLAPALNAAGARVVNVASPRHRNTHLDPDDLRGDHGRPADAYARAQRALLLFTRALAETAEQRIIAVAVHPGCIDTGTFTACMAPVVCPWPTARCTCSTPPTRKSGSSTAATKKVCCAPNRPSAPTTDRKRCACGRLLRAFSAGTTPRPERPGVSPASTLAPAV